jgi:hypothetical protein
LRSRTLSFGASERVSAGTVISTIAAAVRKKIKIMYKGRLDTSLLYTPDSDLPEDEGEGVAIGTWTQHVKVLTINRPLVVVGGFTMIYSSMN